MVITGDYLFVGLVILGGMLTLISLKVSLILFRLGAALAWLTLAILLMTNQLATGMAQPWTQALGLVFLVMTVAPLTLQMVTEVRRESGGKTWSKWGEAPKEESLSRSAGIQDNWQKQLREKRRGRTWRQ